MESSKLKLVSLLTVISATIILFGGLVLLWWNINTIVFSHGVLRAEEGPAILMRFIIAVVAVILATVDYLAANALHKLKKWAYILLLIQYSVVGLLNLLAAIAGKSAVIIPTLISFVIAYLLYREKDLFEISHSQSTKSK